MELRQGYAHDHSETGAAVNGTLRSTPRIRRPIRSSNAKDECVVAEQFLQGQRFILWRKIMVSNLHLLIHTLALAQIVTLQTGSLVSIIGISRTYPRYHLSAGPQ